PPIVGAQTPAGHTDILISYTYRLAFESGRGVDYGLASAVTLVIFLITGTLTFINFSFTGALEEIRKNVSKALFLGGYLAPWGAFGLRGVCPFPQPVGDLRIVQSRQHLGGAGLDSPQPQFG